MWLFLVLWVATGLALIGAYRKIAEVQKMEKSRSHAFCVATVFSVVGDAHAARTLRAAADRYDSVEEQPKIRLLAKQRYTADSPSVPALWLRAEADRLDPQSIEEKVDA